MKAVIDAQSLKDLVDKTKRFVSKNFNNEMMRYIHIVVDAEKREVKAEAVDGHRFSIAYCKLTQGEESFECFITPDIPRVTKYDISAEIELVGDKAFVTVGDSIRGYRQPKGSFLDLRKIIKPVDVASVKIGFNVKLLAEALQSVKDHESTYNAARIYIYDDKQPMIIRSNEKDIAGVLPTHIDGRKWQMDLENSEREKQS